MIKFKFLLFSLILSTFSFSQNGRIFFQYDLAGNQIVRSFCGSCKFSDKNDISEIEDKEYIKSYSEDFISYYPNPVKDELYVKWNNIDDNYVINFEIYNSLGSLILKKEINKEQNKITINLNNSSSGYLVGILFYSNGRKESFKIIKE